RGRIGQQFASSAVAGTDSFADRRNSAAHQNSNQVMKAGLNFVHEFVPGSSTRTLLLLHGTGGNEHDLIPLGREIDHISGVLLPLGTVLDYSMPRLFRKLTGLASVYAYVIL